MMKCPLVSVVCLAMVVTGPSVAQGPFEKAALAWTLPWDADWVTAVTFVGDRRVVAGNNLGQIAMWELPENASDPAPKPMRRFDGHTNVITRLLCSPDGRWLISSSNDHTIRFWDMDAAAAKKGTIVLNARAIAEAAEKKKKAPPAPLEAPVELLEASKVWTGHRDWVVAMSLSRDGQTLASGDEKGEVIIWDVAAGAERKRWKVKGWVWALALAPDAEALAVSERIPLVFDSGRYSAMKIWSPLGEMKIDLSKTVEKQMTSSARYSPDGKTLALGRGGEADGLSGKVTLLDAETGKVRKELTPGHLNGLTDMAFHPEEKWLASAGRDTQVRIWDIESGKLLKELGQSRGGQSKDWIHAVAFSPNGHWLAAADMAGMVHVYRIGGLEKE
jgi:WD40 repeat protein